MRTKDQEQFNLEPGETCCMETDTWKQYITSIKEQSFLEKRNWYHATEKNQLMKHFWWLFKKSHVLNHNTRDLKQRKMSQPCQGLAHERVKLIICLVFTQLSRRCVCVWPPTPRSGLWQEPRPSLFCWECLTVTAAACFIPFQTHGASHLARG